MYNLKMEILYYGDVFCFNGRDFFRFSNVLANQKHTRVKQVLGIIYAQFEKNKNFLAVWEVKINYLSVKKVRKMFNIIGAI